MNLPLPAADGATAAEVRDWLDRFAACVREVDYAAARPFWHPDIVIFGTYQELVKSLPAWTERQWDNVWPRTADFRFDLANTMVMAAPAVRWRLRSRPGRVPDFMRMEHPSTVRAAPPSCWRDSRTGAGSAFIRTCRWRAACRRIATGSAP